MKSEPALYSESDHDRALERHAMFHEDMVATRKEEGADSPAYAYARKLMLDAWREVQRVCSRPKVSADA